MALTDENPHVLNVAIIADPTPAEPYGYRAIVDTDLDPGTTDPVERIEVKKLVGQIEAHMRAGQPGLTAVTLHRR